MKCLPLTALLFLFLSCNEQEPKANKPVITNASHKSDSGLAKKEITNPYAPTDLSPVDIAYFPVDYPVKKMTAPATKMPVARVIYSRPHRQGRTIFGSLLPYGEPWRLGANEATEIEFFQPVIIQNKRVPKGRYVLYSIPQQDEWTLVLNSNVFSWGLKQDTQKDLFRFKIPVQRTPTTIEYFTMVFEPTDSGATLLMAWDDVVARLPLSF